MHVPGAVTPIRITVTATNTMLTPCTKEGLVTHSLTLYSAPRGREPSCSVLVIGISSHVNRMLIYAITVNTHAVESDSECNPTLHIKKIEQCTNTGAPESKWITRRVSPKIIWEQD